VFDTLEATRKLRAAGFTEEQAESAVRMVRDAQSELATKGDLRDAIKTQTINVGAMLAGSVGVILAAIKWL